MIDFMIIGAQKAATSSLQYYLRQSKDVFMPEGESPIFEYPEIHSKMWLDIGEPGKVCGIKRPDILCSDHIISHVFENIEKCKIIVVLRDPISRGVSAYYHLVRHCHLRNKSLNVGLKQCLLDFNGNKNNLYSSVVSNGLYGRYLEEWSAKYGSDNILVFSQLDVRNDLPRTLEVISEFLRVDMIKPSNLDVSEKNVGFYSRFSIFLYRIGHYLKTEKIGAHGRRIPRDSLALKAFGQIFVILSKFYAKFFPGEPDKISSENLTKLEEIYNEDFKLLKEIVGEQVVYWK